MKYLKKIKETLDTASPNQSSILNFYLNLSILEGEYYSEGDTSLLYKNLKSEVTEIRENLSSNILTFSNKIRTLQSRIDNTNRENKFLQIGELSIGIKELQLFTKNIDNYFNLITRAEEDFTQFDSLQSLHETKEIIDIDELKSYKRSKVELEESLVLINISLSEIDMNLDCSIYIQKKIDLCKEYLLKFNNRLIFCNEFVLDILLDKCDYLLYKIYCRKEKHARKVDDFPRIKFYENKKNKISGKNKYYIGFVEKCEKHYFHALIEPTFSELENIEITKIHDACKYYRIKNRQEQIKNLNKQISEVQPNKITKDFNSIAQNSALKFCINSKVRILLNEFKENNFESFFKIIYEGQVEIFFKESLGFDFTNNSNPNLITTDYVPHKFILEFFNDFFDFLISDPLKLLNVDSSEKLRKGENIDNYINQELFGKSAMKSIFEKNLRRITNFLNYGFTYCDIKKLKPIYLPYNDCKMLVRIDDSEIKRRLNDESIDEIENLNLFLDSSYILPIDYEQVKSEIINLSWD